MQVEWSSVEAEAAGGGGSSVGVVLRGSRCRRLQRNTARERFEAGREAVKLGLYAEDEESSGEGTVDDKSAGAALVPCGRLRFLVPAKAAAGKSLLGCVADTKRVRKVVRSAKQEELGVPASRLGKLV